MNILEVCKQKFLEARGKVADAMPLLWEIMEKNLWEDRYSSFGEYCDACEISRSFASRLATVHHHYTIEGGISRLNDVDPDKLYLAIKLTGSPQEQLAKAASLSRAELKEQTVFEKTGEEHTCSPICRTCHRSM